MKEITITKTVILPTKEEIAATVKGCSPIEPQQTILVTCFVMGYEFESEENKAVYECMAEADESLRRSIALDVVTAYCDEHKIKWGTTRVISVTNYGKHYVIEGLITLRNE